MGITGLIPFLEKASKRANISEFSGSTVAIDTYCWLHKGAFGCADKLVRGEDTDVYVKYCLKYVTMLLSKNIKPILVFDGRHLPAKAMTETKRRESRDICKKRAAELLSLGKIEEARSHIRRSVDITHKMALTLIKECRKRNVDCIVAPYEADAQLAYLNIKNYAQVVITEDSDLILFGCTKVLFKMDLDGTGTLVDTTKLPLVMKCPIEIYTFDKFRQMCIMSGCDYLASLPGIGLAKARQFVTATQDSNFANALRKLPSFFNRSNLVVTDEYRENFLKAEATFKHQYVYDPIERKMLRLTEPDDEDIELALCVNAGELLNSKIAYQLALGNIEPFTLNKLDDWDPDINNTYEQVKTTNWKDKGVSNHPSIWNPSFSEYLKEQCPWAKKINKLEPIISTETRSRKKIVTLVSKYVPETQDQSLSIETLSNMYCTEPASKKQKTDNSESYTDSENVHNIAILETTKSNEKSPILENKERSYRKSMRNKDFLKKLSKFPRTILDNDVIESNFFNTTPIVIEESPEKNINPFKVQSQSVEQLELNTDLDINSSQKENSFSPTNSSLGDNLDNQTDTSPKTRNPFKLNEQKKNIKSDTQCSSDTGFSEMTDSESVIEDSQPVLSPIKLQPAFKQNTRFTNNHKKSTCRVPGLKKTMSLPNNQPTLLSKFGFQKKPVLKR